MKFVTEGAQVQGVPSIDEEEEGGEGNVHGKTTKGAARRKAGIPHKGKSAGKGKEAKESRERRSGMPHRGKGTARKVKKKFVEGLEEESRVVLWTNSATGRGVVRVRIAWPRGRCHVPEMPKM